MGNWVQLVQEEVVEKDCSLYDHQIVRGHIQYKYMESMKKKMPSQDHIHDVTLIDPG